LQKVVLALLAGVLLVGPAGTIASAAPKPNAFNFTMSGEAVVPGPGDPDGTACANVSLFFSKPYTVCAAANPQDSVQRPFTSLELHRAPAGEAGPTVITFDLARGGPTDMDGCANPDKRLMQDIQDNPELYYLEAENVEFPNGAIRGQLG
jgi:CHRD domain